MVKGDEIKIKTDNLHLELKDLISERNYVENEFLEPLKEEQKIARGPLRIIDVKSKYHLKTLKKQGHIFGKIFGSSGTVVTIICCLQS